MRYSRPADWKQERTVDGSVPEQVQLFTADLPARGRVTFACYRGYAVKAKKGNGIDSIWDVCVFDGWRRRLNSTRKVYIFGGDH